jgi:beta-phosphoglucomutase-like phosphatase (HAD superfamily)
MISPEIAVREYFRWSFDMIEIDKIVSVYTQTLQTLSGNVPTMDANVNPPTAASQVTDESAVLELQYVAWTKVAEENGFAAPMPEEVLAASVLNDPEAVVRGGFGWTDDPLKTHALALRYKEVFTELVNARVHNRTVQLSGPSPISKEPSTKVDSKTPSGPTPQEILQMHMDAWKVASSTHHFKAPAAEQINVTLNMGVSETVRLLLAWTYNFNDDQIKAISATYENALIEASKKYIDKYNVKPEAVALPPKTLPAKVANKTPSGDELFQAVIDAWNQIAIKRGYSPVDQEQIQFAMAVGPEEGIITGFQWTNDRTEAASIAQEYKAQIANKRQQWQKEGATMNEADASKDRIAGGEEKIPRITAIPNVGAWVKSLRDVDMECGVVSFLNGSQVAMLLEYVGLANYFPPDKRVSSSNGYDRESQQLLGAALRIERRPDHCVVFDSSPYGNGAAGEVNMRSVAIVGPYPRYELLTADASAASFDELTAMNIRRLFGERVYDQPMLDLQPKQPEARPKKVKTQYWDDE